MPLSVLTDKQIGFLLDNLTLDELDGFSGCLKAALHEYSVGTQGKFPDDDVQPKRQTIRSRATGTTTLFMPSRGPSGLGVKVITLSPPSKPKEGNSRQTPTPTEGDKTAIPSDDDSISGATSVVRPTGAITLFSPTGSPVAILHASQLTAFRTALASHCLVQRRETVRTLTVFGAGLQAYYHVRLALMSKGSTIKHVNVVSHRFSDTCRLLMKKFYSNIDAETKLKEGWSNTKFSILTPAYVEYDRLLKEQVRAADVIFCCTPSTKELFPGSYLTNPEGRKKGRLVVAIGSYTPEMAELPVDLVRQATRRHEPWQHHFHRHAREGGVIVVDTLDGALKEAGEIIAAGLKPSQLVELGEVVMLRRLTEQEEEQPQQRQREDADSVASGGGGSGSTSALNSPLTPEFEKSDLTPGSSAKSSVFSSAYSARSSSVSNITLAGTAASSRSSSPGLGRKSSGSSNTTISFAPDNHPKRALSTGSSSSPSTTTTASRSSKKAEKEDQLARWLQTGNVIYKSVGLGLMDLAVGMHLVEFAREKGVGTHVDEF